KLFSIKLVGSRRKVCRLQSLRSGSGKCISRKSRAVSGVNIKVLNTASCGEEVVDSVMVVRHLIFMMTRHYGYPRPLTSASFSLCEPFSEEFSLRCNAYIGHGIVYAKMPGNHMLTGHQQGHYASAGTSSVIGCSQRRRVDISICHLQVSQSVTTRSAPLSSIWRNSGAPMACEVG